MDLPHQLLLFAASLLANLFSALSGGGAGLIRFPILIFLGLPFGVALATHQVARVALGLGATVRHLKESQLARRESLIILGAGLPGVVLGASTILRVPEDLATFLLGLLTLGLGVYSSFRPRLDMKNMCRATGRAMVCSPACWACSWSAFSTARSLPAPGCFSPSG